MNYPFLNSKYLIYMTKMNYSIYKEYKFHLSILDVVLYDSILSLVL